MHSDDSVPKIEPKPVPEPVVIVEEKPVEEVPELQPLQVHSPEIDLSS